MCGIEFLKFDLQSMKTMKYILLIICVVCASTMMAVDYKLHQSSSFKSTSSTQFYSGSGVGVTLASTTVATVPTVEFHSTSAMPSVGSSLSTTPNIAVDDAGMTVTPGPKRARPDDWNDPYKDPIGDAVLPLLLLAAAYGIYLRRKNRVQTPESGHQQ